MQLMKVVGVRECDWVLYSSLSRTPAPNSECYQRGDCIETDFHHYKYTLDQLKVAFMSPTILAIEKYDTTPLGNNNYVNSMTTTEVDKYGLSRVPTLAGTSASSILPTSGRQYKK